ncbi:hypothetical protein PPERSA_08081 [Pseudocohnilembus persalinus]|uniref:Uncharacterized protein n=1 Tax=Pseudocohnilembus persalinus TaxID=266149 RepID=A0A0V0R2N5_PSEPJ|nr:hypothetical protein PPERSA_08081 [Pseudocohnilembus persalinus]|eukprot:KRX08770.1 hypothetical protein PPERSA_08081 [Pseudocohnilembus persalinus]
MKPEKEQYTKNGAFYKFKQFQKRYESKNSPSNSNSFVSTYRSTIYRADDDSLKQNININFKALESLNLQNAQNGVRIKNELKELQTVNENMSEQYFEPKVGTKDKKQSDRLSYQLKTTALIQNNQNKKNIKNLNNKIKKIKDDFLDSKKVKFGELMQGLRERKEKLLQSYHEENLKKEENLKVQQMLNFLSKYFNSKKNYIQQQRMKQQIVQNKNSKINSNSNSNVIQLTEIQQSSLIKKRQCHINLIEISKQQKYKKPLKDVLNQTTNSVQNSNCTEIGNNDVNNIQFKNRSIRKKIKETIKVKNIAINSNDIKHVDSFENHIKRKAEELWHQDQELQNLYKFY